MKLSAEDPKEIELSVVVPVYNEAESLPLLVPQLVEVLNRLRRRYEIIVVDDKSSDGSREVLKGMVGLYPSLCLLFLDRNYGLSTALVAGMRQARGGWIATIDSDLQMDPADLPRLLNALNSSDMATGWRQERKDTLMKRLSSKIANAVRNWLSADIVNDSACTFRVFRRECVQEIPVFSGMHRFLPTLVKMEGYRVIEIPITHHPRRFGKSKFNIRNRIWRSFIDLLGVRWMKSRQIQYEIEERI